MCDGIIARMNSADSAVDWEITLPEVDAAFHLKYDSEEESLYVTTTVIMTHVLLFYGHQQLITTSIWRVLWRDHRDGVLWTWVESNGPFVYVIFDDVAVAKVTRMDLSQMNIMSLWAKLWLKTSVQVIPRNAHKMMHKLCMYTMEIQTLNAKTIQKVKHVW